MNNKQIKNLIEEGFGNLYPLTYTSYTDYRAEMLDYEITQEKNHRRYAPSDYAPKFSIRMLAKYFVLKSFRSAMLSNDFRPRDILHCKQSYIMAHAVKDAYPCLCNEIFDRFDWEAFDSIDYSQGDLIFVETVDEVAA